jgi:hypothetical protein
MKALLRLYPRGWRERYAAEVADYLDEARPPLLRTATDLIAGAIDARLNPEYMPEPSGEGASNMLARHCRFDDTDVPVRDAIKSACLMIGICLVATVIGVALDVIYGDHVLIQAMLYSSFFIALTISSRYTYLRAYSATVKNTLAVLSVPVWYGFFVVVAILGERF